MNDRERTFADEYLVDLNATAAALRAGYSVKTARNAAEWIKESDPKKPKLRALIDVKLAERSRRTGITADRVLNELAKIAFVNPADVIDVDSGTVLENAGRDDRAAIRSVTVKRGNTDETAVELYDKTRALELLGKHLGLFTENVEIKKDTPTIIFEDGGDA